MHARFMHFNYMPTGRAEKHVELDLTPKERLYLLETIGRKIVGLYLKAKEEEQRTGKTNIKTDRFFSTCPQFASVVKRLAREEGHDFTVSAMHACNTIQGNILLDDFEYIWDNNQLLWKLRTREKLECYEINELRIGCGNCPDKYICGGCRARAYSYFNGNINAPDIGCIDNEEIWKKAAKTASLT